VDEKRAACLAGPLAVMISHIEGMTREAATEAENEPEEDPMP
jgi:hypothetical protein